MSIPKAIKLDKSANTLNLTYANGSQYQLPAEYLRVYSPSAEVQGHGNYVLQYGKIKVKLSNIEASGNYALKITFDDGHDSGLYTWVYLEQLANRQDELWQDYLSDLAKAGRSRDPDESVVKLML